MLEPALKDSKPSTHCLSHPEVQHPATEGANEATLLTGESQPADGLMACRKVVQILQGAELSPVPQRRGLIGSLPRETLASGPVYPLCSGNDICLERSYRPGAPFSQRRILSTDPFYIHVVSH